jgi:hypothetical protein
MRSDTGFINNLDEKNRSFFAEFKYYLLCSRYSQIKLQFIHERVSFLVETYFLIEYI